MDIPKPKPNEVQIYRKDAHDLLTFPIEEFDIVKQVWSTVPLGDFKTNGDIQGEFIKIAAHNPLYYYVTRPYTVLGIIYKDVIGTKKNLIQRRHMNSLIESILESEDFSSIRCDVNMLFPLCSRKDSKSKFRVIPLFILPILLSKYSSNLNIKEIIPPIIKFLRVKYDVTNLKSKEHVMFRMYYQLICNYDRVISSKSIATPLAYKTIERVFPNNGNKKVMSMVFEHEATEKSSSEDDSVEKKRKRANDLLNSSMGESLPLKKINSYTKDRGTVKKRKPSEDPFDVIFSEPSE
jgi:hypothetical protein